MDDEDNEPVPPGHLAIWNIKTNEINNAVKVNGVHGNIFAIDEKNAGTDLSILRSLILRMEK